jgi:D-amino-acid dehydrogenase
VRIVVIGGGVIGVTTAYELSKDGHAVTLVERQPDVALECSHANGGYIAVSQAVPWSAPGIPSKVLLGVLARNPPILLRLSQLPAMWRWGLQFLACSRAKRSRENTLHILRLALNSFAALKETRNAEAVDYDPVAKGCLKVFLERSSLEEAEVVSQSQTGHGLRYEVLSASGCADKVPALAPRASELAGGLFYPDEEAGDCFAFTRNLARICHSRGVEFLFDTTVTGLEHDGRRVTAAISCKGHFRADAFVLAAGADSPILARSVGLRLPIIPVKGYSLTFPRSLWPEAPDMPVLDEKRKFGYAPLSSDRLRLTGFAEIAGYDTKPEARRTEAFVRSFTGLFPQLESRISVRDLKPFCCLRPVTPTGLPIIGASRFQNLFYNVGHGHLGWTLAHGSARLLASAISGRTPEIDSRPYCPTSFQ